MAEGRILYCIKDDVCFVRMEGFVTYLIGGDFSAFVEQLFDDMASGGIVVDLSRATHLDSTSLGLLAKVAVLASERLGRKATIVSPNEDVGTVLEEMRLSSLFELSPGMEIPEEGLQQIPHVPFTGRKTASMILKAHDALVEASEENRQAFRKVIDALEKEVSDLPE